MQFKWEKKYLYWGMTALSVITLSILIASFVNNFEDVKASLVPMQTAMVPFVWGFVIAYLLAPIMNFFQTIFLNNRIIGKKLKLVKGLSVTLSLLCLIAFIGALIGMIAPQLVESVRGIIDNSSMYIDNFDAFMTNFLSKHPEVSEIIVNSLGDLSDGLLSWLSQSIMPQIQDTMTRLTSGAIDLLVFVKDIFIGLIISVYILSSKELFYSQTKKLVYSIFKIKVANKIFEIIERSHKIFGGFVTGKIIDSILIGLICFICMTIFGMPFPLLISVIIGITNIIPFFGPFIGAIPSAIFILIVDPMYCLYFAVFILALQQFDGNILGPKILGDSTGLSSFWVIFAILIGGQFGFVGMIVGVPTFAVIYTLVKEYAEYRLTSKELPTGTNRYYYLESIDEQTKSLSYEYKKERLPEIDESKIHSFKPVKRVKKDKTKTKSKNKDKEND